MDLPGYDALLSHLYLSDLHIELRTCIWALSLTALLPTQYASYLLLVHLVSVLLAASSRPLVTKAPLPSRYFLPHVG